MKVFYRYLLLQYKKSLRIVAKTIISSTIILLLLFAGVALISNMILKSQIFKMVEVALVIPEKEQKMKMVTRFISAMDSTKSICHFSYLDEKEAFAALQEDIVQAVIVFPEGFYDDIYYGKNTPVTIYLSSTTDINMRMFRELLKDGISMLQTSEAGVYAVLDAAEIYQTRIRLSDIGDFVAEKYAIELFQRNRLFKKMVVSPLGVTNFNQYYFSALIILVLLISGLNYGFLYKKQCREVEEKLKLYGIGSVKHSIIKVLIMATFLWATALALYLGGCIISSFFESDFLIFHIATVFGFLPLCVSVAAYFHMIYAFVSDGRQGAVLLLTVNIIMILSSGVLIPEAYMAEGWGKIADIMPNAIWQRYNICLMFENSGLEDILRLFGYTVAEMGIGVVGVWKNTSFGISSC